MPDIELFNVGLWGGLLLWLVPRLFGVFVAALREAAN